MLVKNVITQKYTGELIASSGDGMKCRFVETVEAGSPEEARLLIRSHWQDQASRPGMHIREIRLFREDGEQIAE